MIEDAGAADLISRGRLQLGISRGSPEQVIDGWRHFGYAPAEGQSDADMGRRDRLFGACDDQQRKDLASQLVFPGNSFADIIRTISQLKNNEKGLPRSQIYRLLRRVRKNGGYFSENAHADAAKELDRYLLNAGIDRNASAKTINLPVLGAEERRRAFDLALIADLWDYTVPFDAPLPPFPRVEA